MVRAVYVNEIYKKVCKKCGKQYEKFCEDARWCVPCQKNYLKNNFINWTSGNIQIDEFIQEKQLATENYYDKVFEWIPYNQFNKKLNNKVIATIWKDGPLYYDYKNKKKWTRNSDQKVILKFISQNNIDELLNKAKSKGSYGISQNPNTKDYALIISDDCCEECCEEYTNIYAKWCILCQINYLKKNFINWTSENKQIDDFIQEKQLTINNWDDIIFEWIPYNRLENIDIINKNNLAITVWKDGPLFYSINANEFIRYPNEKVALKYISQDNIDVLLFKAKSKGSYGISQNPNTKDYVLVLQDNYCRKCCERYTIEYDKWCKPCQINYLKKNFTNWTSGNEKIDDFIQKKQLTINHYRNKIFEWIPYNQLENIDIINKNNLAITVWKDGPLFYGINANEFIRYPNEKVALKYISPNNIDELLRRAGSEDSYGISQNPNTKDFVLVIQDDMKIKNSINSRKASKKKKDGKVVFCKYCHKKYTDTYAKWCKPCQINYLKKNFKNWTSKNKQIDNLVQAKQLVINNYNDIIFEWIPYKQFESIEEIGKGGFATVFSAIWKNGPLFYNIDVNKFIRNPNEKVALKCLYKSQNITKEFLKEVEAHANNGNSGNILKIHGISQNPDTKEYIMILEYAEGGSFNDYLNKNYENFDWKSKRLILTYIVNGLNEIHQRRLVHRDLHTGNILFKYLDSTYTCISDLGLCGEVDNMDQTKIYGVIPYVAPEVLRGRPYTQAADIYSFGMIMYLAATGRQPFSNRAHDEFLVLDICNGMRPEINELEAPECYVSLMKRCWDQNPDKRPNSDEISKKVQMFLHVSQFEEAEKYRKANLSSIENIQSSTHPQAIYTSRLLNPFTEILQKSDSECLGCAIDD